MKTLPSGRAKTLPEKVPTEQTGQYEMKENNNKMYQPREQVRGKTSVEELGWARYTSILLREELK
jgi:hypothetical protein